MKKKLKDLLDYEQPTKYIVETENYSDEYKLPVLTAGKSFVLGYTNETEGVFRGKNEPVIIFDDFTRDTKYVDFDFKVKSSAMKILHKHNKDDSLKYLHYALNNIKYVPFSHKRLWISDFSNMEIDYPSPEIQNTIATELDTIQSAIDNKKQQLALLDEVVKSRFIEMFGEGRCKQILFSEYAEIIDDDRGKNYPKSEDFSDNDYCLFLSAKNVTKNGFMFETNQFISKEKDEILKKGKLNRGDIVITTRGTIGNIAYYDNSVPYENIRINSGMVIIRNKDLEFNQHFFLEAFRNKIDDIIATQVTGAAQPQLPIHIMSKIILPYPDIKLQNSFAAFVQQIDKSKFVVKQQIKDLQELMDSKMQEYFGE